MKFGDDVVRSGYVLVAALQTPRLENMLGRHVRRIH